MGRPKGSPRPPGSGRAKGTPNKTTLAVKQALSEALEAAHDDGAKGYFLKLSKEEPKVFGTLIGKLIPNEVVGHLTHEHVLEVVDLSDRGSEDVD